MQDWHIGIILGIVEGLTEFLPVSSTGHLILAGHALGFTGPKAETFEVVIQLGAILAIVVLYRDRLLRLAGVRRRRKQPGGGSGTWTGEASGQRSGFGLMHLAAAALPGFAVGLAFHDFIKDVMWSPATVLVGLVAGGLHMMYAERKPTAVRARTIDDLSIRQAWIIGLYQCLAILIPGFSRSGATIAGGMLAGASLRAAADFSFLVAVPMMLGASAFDLWDSAEYLTLQDAELFLTGFVVSFLVAMMAVVSFLKLLEKVSLTAFAFYRMGLAAVFLAYMAWIGL